MAVARHAYVQESRYCREPKNPTIFASKSCSIMIQRSKVAKWVTPRHTRQVLWPCKRVLRHAVPAYSWQDTGGSESQWRSTSTDTSLDVWRSQEPVLDATLSIADRAVLALTRLVTNLSDKAAAGRIAAAHGLVMVTNSEVCVGPLLPPFGSTVDEDGEEGDGMALAPPLQQVATAQPKVHKVNAVAGGATSLLSTVFASGAKDAGTSVSSPKGSGTGSTAAVFPASQPQLSAGKAAGAAPSYRHQVGVAGLPHLPHLMVSEGGGGDEDSSDEAHWDDEHGAITRRHAHRSTDVWVTGGQGANGNGNGLRKDAFAGGQGLMDVAAAALSRVARAATSAAADQQVPVGRAAAGAASAAAQAAHAAVAGAAKATGLAMPIHDEPSSSWLVADDPRGGVRYIVIGAGPDLRRRTDWELTSDLATFETYNLGVKVNKRLYKEAMALYAQFMPMVMDFLEAVPDGNICFGGQGVGGSLALLLQLMCCHRGVRFAQLLPAVAVDAPAVLAHVPLNQRRKWGPTGREQQQLHSQDQLEDVLEDLMSRTVLEELGLPQDAVRNLLLQHPSQPHQGFGMGQGQGPYHQQQHNGRGPMLVMAEADTAGRGSKGRAPSLDPSRAQVFRLIGKVVHVDTIANASSRAAATVAAARGSLSAAAQRSEEVLGSIVETDGGSGDAAVAAAGGADGAASALGLPARRLDMATMGSIATAAATAAASVALQRLRSVSVSAARGTAAGKAGARSAEPRGHKGPASAPGAPGSATAAAVRLGGKGVRAVGDDEDVSAWGV